jgi:hypothetical protein
MDRWKWGDGMSKKKRRRTFIGKMHPQRIWIPEEEVRDTFEFLDKLYPSQVEDSLQWLIDKGYLAVRVVAGRRQFTYNSEIVQAELDKLPPEIRNSGYEITIHEDTAIICDYDHDATTLLSVIIQQTDKIIEQAEVIPWVVKTQEQFNHDTMETVKNVQTAFSKLEQKNFIEVAEGGPTRYRYRLNVPVVQGALNALPVRDGRDAQ